MSLTIWCGVWEVSVGDQLVGAAITLVGFFLYTLQPEKRWRRTSGIERVEQAGWDPGQFWACTKQVVMESAVTGFFLMDIQYTHDTNIYCLRVCPFDDGHNLIAIGGDQGADILILVRSPYFSCRRDS